MTRVILHSPNYTSDALLVADIAIVELCRMEVSAARLENCYLGLVNLDLERKVQEPQSRGPRTRRNTKQKSASPNTP